MRPNRFRSVVAALVGIALAAPVRAEPDGAAPFPGGASEVLARYQTADEITAFMGIRPFLCAQTSDSHRICTWQASKRQPGWRALAPTVPTTDRVNLVCELPNANAPRDPDSCSVHPRRSNRNAWREATLEDAAASWPADEEERKRAAARSLIDRARTALELSRLVGQGPESCELELDTRRCLWRTTAKTEGHGTLAMAIGVPPRKKVRLECWLPTTGKARQLETCKVEVGS